MRPNKITKCGFCWCECFVQYSKINRIINDGMQLNTVACWWCCGEHTIRKIAFALTSNKQYIGMLIMIRIKKSLEKVQARVYYTRDVSYCRNGNRIKIAHTHCSVLRLLLLLWTRERHGNGDDARLSSRHHKIHCWTRNRFYTSTMRCVVVVVVVVRLLQITFIMSLEKNTNTNKRTYHSHLHTYIYGIYK